MSIVDAAQVLQSLHIPGQVITDDISAGWVFVGVDNLVRVLVTADTFITFAMDNSGVAAVDASTSPAVKLSAGEHYIICTADYIKSSSNPARVELLGL